MDYATNLSLVPGPCDALDASGPCDALGASGPCDALGASGLPEAATPTAAVATPHDEERARVWAGLRGSMGRVELMVRASGHTHTHTYGQG